MNDFIDMSSDQHRRAVERTLRDALKRDRAKTKILRTSPLGLVEMTRQRIRPGIQRSFYRECPCCHGGGAIKSLESMSLEIVRLLTLASQKPRASFISVGVSEEVAEYMNNKKRNQIVQIETDANVSINVKTVPNVWPEYIGIDIMDAAGKKVDFSKEDSLLDS